MAKRKNRKHDSRRPLPPLDGMTDVFAVFGYLYTADSVIYAAAWGIEEWNIVTLQSRVTQTLFVHLFSRSALYKAIILPHPKRSSLYDDCGPP